MGITVLQTHLPSTGVFKKQKKKKTGFLWPCSYWCCASILSSPEMLENFEPQLAT